MEPKYEILLNLIEENKHILFGKFSSSITHKDKENTWQKIIDGTKAHGHDFVPQTTKLPPWKYMRDTVWATNLKNRTLVC